MSECEYSLQCLGEKAEYACVAPENHQECAQYRDFSVKAKQRDIEVHYIKTKVMLPDMDLYNDDALLCEAINKMRR